MRTKRRTLVATVCAISLGAILTGCGNGSTTASPASDNEPITLTFWDHEQSSKEMDAAYKDAAAAFTKANPNVTVTIQTFPFEQYQEKLLTAVKGKKGPDIMSLDQPWIPQFAESGVIQPLNDFTSKSTKVTKDQFYSAAWDSTLWKDKQWAVPLGFDVWEELVWNPELFTKAGLDPNTPPKTWDELLDFAKKLTGNGQYGIVLPSAKSEVIPVFNNSFIYSNGGAIIDDSGKVVIDSPENLKTYSYLYKDLIKYAPDGMTNMDQGAAEALFTSGKVAMMFDGNWSQETMDSQASFDWKIAVPPVPNAGDTFHGATGGWNLAVSANSANAQAAYDFIDFLTTTIDTQVAVAANTPAFIPAAKVYLEKRKYPEVLASVSETGMPRPKTPVYPKISEIQQTGVQRMIQGEDIATVMKDMQKQIEQATGQ
ncbi:MAG: ABC transporter substrate-binding protein [Nostocoides sp.]